MPKVASDYTKTYTSFSGCDIVCTFGSTTIGELQAITYHVQREKAPIYTMGSAEPRSFSRGKRGIAGTLVFTLFDRDALLASLKDDVLKEESFQRIGGDTFTNENNVISIDEWDKQMAGIALNGVDGRTGQQTAAKITSQVAAAADPQYDDELPPFDITISFANEYGQKATIVIYGVEILNEGTGFSIDNVTSEKACTFVARRVEYMRPVTNTDSTTGSAKAGDSLQI